MIEQIDKYLKGELTEAERIAFEKQVEADSALAEELKAQVKAEYAIRTEAKAAQKAALKVAYARLEAEGGLTQIRPFYQRSGFLVAVAAAVVLLFFAVRFLGESPQMSPDELFAAHMEPQPISFTRGSQDTALINLGNAYQQADYSQAITEAEKLLADSLHASSPKIWLSLAISQLMINQPQAALESLKEVDEGSAFREQKLWYEALALLKVDLVMAKEKLLVISQSEHYMSQDAKQILDGIKE